MARRSIARWLAPLALAGAVVAIVVVLSGSSGGSGRAAATTPTVTAPPTHRPHKRYYFVKAGDVLSRIAERTGVPMATLQKLNPKLEPELLQRGQRIKLR